MKKPNYVLKDQSTWFGMDCYDWENDYFGVDVWTEDIVGPELWAGQPDEGDPEAA